MGCRVLSSNNYRITCGFPSHQQRVRGRQHIYGCDIVTAAYTTCEITAHSAGTVKRVINYIKGHEVDRQGYGYGNQVIIEHKNGVCTIYCHMKPGSICVSEGQQVKAGDVIGYMGNTGSSYGAHLDFSVIKLKTGYNMENVDILKDIDVKFNYYDPELYLDADLPGAEEKIIERVQVGSFEHPEYAVRRYDLLKSEGYDVLIKFSAGHYRVQVGAFENHTYALNMYNKLAKKYDCYITTEAGEEIGIDTLRKLAG